MKSQDVSWGFLAHPDTGTHAGIVIVHDVWGLSELYREFARRLAQAGFTALALDLYRREVKITNPGEWMRGLSDPKILEDVQSAIDFLHGHPAVGGGRVGVAGFCIGGTYALLAACACQGLAAAVSFYGILSYQHGLLFSPDLDPAKKPRDPLHAIRDLRCPLFGIFGESDEFIPLDDVKQLEAGLARGTISSEVRVYPGCGHAFLNETRAQAFRPDSAADAWQRMLDWFGRFLV
jgi:carboxymethylenebutenolidase